MGISIAKKLTDGGATDTTYTINNFTAFSTKADIPVENIPDIIGDEADARLFSMLGARMQITIEWTILDETSSVVTGTGSPVTTAIAQVNYLNDTFIPQGATQYENNYTLTVSYSGGGSLVRNGRVTSVSCVMTSDEPLTFKGSLTFEVGLVL